MSSAYTYTISYGKARVPLHRVYARPLTGVTPIPESPFTGRENTLFATEIDVEVFGNNFLPAYTHGDNSMVVATDSMKNVVLTQALAYEGATLEGFLALLGRLFLSSYAQMERLRLSGTEQPFIATPVPQAAQGSFGPSDRLFARSHDDRAVAVLECDRGAEGFRVAGHRCGRTGLQLLKVTGSAFTHFVRDEHTTLPERLDRPLFIYLDVYWRYHSVDDMLSPTYNRYIPAEQVRDVAQTVFHEFVSESIQHLVHEIGLRLLDRFPQLAEVSFDAQNHTWNPVAQSERDPRQKVYTHPLPAFGLIHLTMGRKD